MFYVCLNCEFVYHNWKYLIDWSLSYMHIMLIYTLENRFNQGREGVYSEELLIIPVLLACMHFSQESLSSS